MAFNILLPVLSLLTITTFVTSQELTGDEFTYEAYLDFSRTFLIKWGFNETHMVFEVTSNAVVGRSATRILLREGLESVKCS